MRPGTVLLGATVAVALTACGIGSDAGSDPSADPSGDPTVSSSSSPGGFSRLDDAGVDRIKAEHAARFDLRDHRVTRADVGLPKGDLGPIVGNASDPPVTLELVGPEGTERAVTSTFSVAFGGPYPQAVSITWFEAYDTDEEGDAALRKAVTSRGLPADQPAFVRDRALSDGDRVTLDGAVSPAGLVNEVTVRGRDGGGQIHQWAVLLSDSLYTPQALEQIRRTGRIPLE